MTHVMSQCRRNRMCGTLLHVSPSILSTPSRPLAFRLGAMLSEASVGKGWSEISMCYGSNDGS